MAEGRLIITVHEFVRCGILSSGVHLVGGITGLFFNTAKQTH